MENHHHDGHRTQAVEGAHPFTDCPAHLLPVDPPQPLTLGAVCLSQGGSDLLRQFLGGQADQRVPAGCQV